ncbi:MAG TPA: hypothetical protein VJ302_28395, partial [Blastocatellia bacterium]|nr:hypothetical protein [Blastocatellia bacterium]
MDESSAKSGSGHPAGRSIFDTARVVAKTLGLLLMVLTISFFVFSVLPSDPIRNALGFYASEERVTMMRRELGYDRPLAERYFRFVKGVFQLD